jgi:hypothetical protein
MEADRQPQDNKLAAQESIHEILLSGDGWADGPGRNGPGMNIAPDVSMSSSQTQGAPARPA